MVQPDVETLLASLKRSATKATLEGMSRYGIPSDNAFGVSMAHIQMLAKRVGLNHVLAAALWGSGFYEARMLASLIDDPELVTAGQIDRWCGDFDNWAICDTVCFKLFDRTPHAWAKVKLWSDKREEFGKRAAFALLWGLTTHDKRDDDAPFGKALLLVERAAIDERNFAKKSVNMALRSIGKRKCGTECRGSGGCPASGGFDGGCAAMGGKRCAERANESGGDSPPRSTTRRINRCSAWVEVTHRRHWSDWMVEERACPYQSNERTDA